MLSRRRIKSANTLYAIGVWGLIAGSVLLAVLAAFAPEVVTCRELQLSTVISALAFLLPSSIYVTKPEGKALFERLRLSSVRPSIIWIFPMAVAGYFLFGGLGSLFAMLAESIGYDTAYETAMNEALITSGDMPALVLLVGVAPALAEEFMFRGVIMPAYEEKGKWPAVLISGAMFALLHGQLVNLPVLLMLGIVLGLIAWHSKSVLPAMLYHGLHNTISVGMAKLSMSAAAEAGDAAELLNTELSAVITLIIMALVGGLLFALTMRAFLHSCKRYESGIRQKPDLNPAGRIRPARFPYLPLVFAAAAILLLFVSPYIVGYL